ncbi:SLBB domain-containing protein [Pelomonas sp. V22]|nr:SLBB domain-containing protein [Pelomonas sp. V22]
MRSLQPSDLLPVTTTHLFDSVRSRTHRSASSASGERAAWRVPGVRALLLATAVMTMVCGASAQSSRSTGTSAETSGSGPVKLGTSTQRQTGSRSSDDTSAPGRQRSETGNDRERKFGQGEGNRRNSQDPLQRDAFAPRSDFEKYVQQAAGDLADGAPEIRRFGSELMLVGRDRDRESGSQMQEASPQIPPDYLITPGDELTLTLWGSVEGDLQLQVDRSGRITIPRVGPVLVAGVSYAELDNVISRQVAKVFKNFQLSTSLNRLRSIKIYMTGFTTRPGAYTVSSLSTLTQALINAGGPSDAGSFRNIELRRQGKTISHFDFYSLLIKGDSSADRTLQAGDVIYIAPVGPQAALIGSVNKAAIFELRPGESVEDLLQMAGGFTAVADRSRLSVERLDSRSDTRIVELALPAKGKLELRDGDLLRAYSAIEVALPKQRQNKRVRVEGEVARPGEYILPPGSSINDAVAAAGGFTANAYVFGTEFNRESVRLSQQENYERALRDLETEFARSATTQKTMGAEEAAAQSNRAQGSHLLLARLREARPNGRIVLQLTPTSTTLPNLPLEDGDRILLPAQPTSISVFGSVFNGGSFLFKDGHSIGDFLRLAGGPTRGADTSSIFVVRPNGSVVSARQRSSGWFSGSSALEAIQAHPGDTIFVPEELNKTTFVQDAKEWTQILYQFGIGAAALKSFRN